MWDDRTADVSSVRCPLKNVQDACTQSQRQSYESQESRETSTELSCVRRRVRLQKAVEGTPHDDRAFIVGTT